jgi:hypothetical protein
MNTIQRDIAVTLCTPAVRLVVVVATAAAHAIYPVVALRGVVRRTYTRHSTDPYAATRGSKQELLQCGFAITSQKAMTFALYIDAGSLTATDAPLPAGQARGVFACSWPATEDEEQLAGAIAALMKQAQQPRGDQR